MKKIIGNKAYEVYVTNDYKAFKKLEGNRPVTSGRKDKILKSIEDIGWIRNPITCNEKLEIIDGQGRFEALQELGYPIEYIIDEGIGIEECRRLNLNQQNWNLRNYTESYAASGNENYKYLLKLMDDHKMVGSQVVIFSITFVARRTSEDVVKQERIICDEKRYKEADKALSILDDIFPFIKKVQGRKATFFSAVVFILMKGNADIDRLTYVLKKKIATMPPVTSFENSFCELEKLYNKGYRGKLASFYNEWMIYHRHNK